MDADRQSTIHDRSQRLREDCQQEVTMLDHKIGSSEEWQAAREALAKLEAEHAELGKKVTEQRRQLPWVLVDKEYQFDTEDGKETLAELFDGGRAAPRPHNIIWAR